MGVIAVYSIKGGVGKTTLAVDLAWRSASLGHHNTLLWDLDPQGGSGFLLGCDQPEVARAAAVFQRDGKPHKLITHTSYERLSIIAADDSLRSLPMQLARLGKRKRLATLTGFLKAEFARIVIDCPPMLNEVSEQIMAAADVLIVPLPPSPLASRALATIRADLTRNHQRHPPILPVLSMYDGRRKSHREVRESLPDHTPVIPMASPIEQSAFRRAPVGTFANSSEPSRALERTWRAVEAKLADLGCG